MDEGYKIRDQGAIHFLTLTVVDWVDIFTRKVYKDIVLDSIRFCQKNKGLDVYGFVIMSNHVHLLVQARNNNLSDLIRDIKSFVAKQILNQIIEGPESRRDWILKRFEFAAQSSSRNSKFQFWRYGNHPEEIFSEKFLWTKLNYFHMNPVRSGIVSKASEYLYSSASNYVSGKGLVDFDLPSVPIIDVHAKSKYNVEIDVW